MCDPDFRATLAAHGYQLEAETGEIVQLEPYVGEFSARAAQIGRHVDRYEAKWRTEHPDEEPGRGLRRAWDRRAWAQARPDKVVPKDGSQLAERWRQELRDLGFTPPVGEVAVKVTPVGRVDRDGVADVVLSRLGARRSSWNAADIRGEVEHIVAATNVVTAPAVRRELVEDLTSRTLGQCVPLLDRHDVPEHVRALTSHRVLEVEADLVARLTARAEGPAPRIAGSDVDHGGVLDPTQQRVAGVLAGTGPLLVIEGAAGTGKTATLTVARAWVEMLGHRLVVVTPTLRAARVAGEQVGPDAFSAAWLVYQHGYRWDQDGRWTRHQVEPTPRARLRPGDLLLVDEAGMLDQDTALALLTIADEAHARIAFAGDRHQLPVVGRGGVLDHATRWARPHARITLETVHRFTDPDYARLSQLTRTGERAGEVFDTLLSRGEIVIHPTGAELTATLTTALTSDFVDRAGTEDGLVIADTREQVRALNAAIRDHRLTAGEGNGEHTITTGSGEQIGVGDRIATRRNDPDLGVANRDTWTVTGIDTAGALHVHGRPGPRTLPAGYVGEHVELAYATTVYGAQGETVQTAHLVVGDSTGAAAAYVGMTRGRAHNTAHLVAETLEDARAQWIAVFSRDRADLGPTHAAQTAAEAIERLGPEARARYAAQQASARMVPQPHATDPYAVTPSQQDHGIGR